MARIVIEVDTKTGRTNVKGLENEFKSLDKAVDNSTRDIKKFSSESTSALKKVAVAAGGIFAVAQIARFTGELIKIADTYTLIDSKISLATKNQEEFNKAYEELYRIGRETGSTLEVNAQAFNRLALSMDVDIDELLRSQELLNKGMVIAGATATETAGFMLQYAQAMGTGVVNGDELKGMNEANSYLMAKIARELETNIAGLKAMGAAGTLTSEKFFKALLKIGNEVDEHYGKIPVTIKQAMNDLQEVWKRIIGDSNKVSGATRSIADAISDFAKTIDDNKAGIIAFFVKMIDLSSKAARTIGNIGQSFEGWAGVKTGEIGFFDFAMMNPEELRDTLDGLNKEGSAIRKLNLDLQGYIDKRKEIQQLFAISPERQKWKKEEIAAIDAIIKKIEEEKAALSKESTVKLKADNTQVKTSLEQVNEAFRRSAEQWMEDNGKTAEKVIKNYLKAIKEANQEILSDTRDLAEEISDLAREGMTDREAWEDVTSSIASYRREAEKAAKAGDWENQLDYLRRAKGLISQLPSEGVTMEVSEDAVKRAKQVAQAAADAARYHSTSFTREAAQKAYDIYRRLLSEQKSGGKVEISKQDALNEKIKLTKSIGEEIIEIKQAHLDKLKEEANEYEKTFEVYKEELKNVKDATDTVTEGTQAVGDTWVKVGDDWKRVSADMISDVNDINNAVTTLATNLRNVEFRKNEAGEYTYDGARANGGDVSAGRRYLVGERGRELFVPKYDGTIIPNNQISDRSSGSVSVNLTLPVSKSTVSVRTDKAGLSTLLNEANRMRRRSN